MIDCIISQLKLSKAAIKRLIQQSAVDVDQKTITNPDFKLTKDCNLKVGKYHYYQIKIKSWTFLENIRNSGQS